MALIDGIHHVALRVRDLDRTLALYTALGFRTILHWGEGESAAAMADIGNGELLEVFAGGSGLSQNGSYIHLAFKVPSCDAAFAAALAAGATERSAPHDITIAGDEFDFPARIAFVYGFDGEEYEFFEARRAL